MFNMEPLLTMNNASSMKNEEDDSEENEMVPEDMEFIHESLEESENLRLGALPARSRENYEKSYQLFMDWCKDKTILAVTEEALLRYIAEKSVGRKPTTLWSEYSKLKATLAVYNDIDVRKYTRLLAFLKTKSRGYKAKSSRTLTREEVDKFLIEAPNKSYLMIKVALIFGIAGAMRLDELTNITLDDIVDAGPVLIVKIRESESNPSRTFTIIANEEHPVDFLKLYRDYVLLRPKKTEHRRLFLNYRAGKCSTQVVGRNTFGKLPSRIAEFLDLPHASEYTGHCFRKSSVSFTSDKQVDVHNYKRCGVWKPIPHLNVSAIENSADSRLNISQMLTNVVARDMDVSEESRISNVANSMYQADDSSTENAMFLATSNYDNYPGNDSNEDRQELPRKMLKTADGKQELDEFDVFGNFVAAELRNLRSQSNQRKLKRLIQQAILDISEHDEGESSIASNCVEDEDKHNEKNW